MTRCAPRYDPRVVDAVRRLDDEREPMAETCRRVGEVMAGLGLPRPSYVHLRRLVKAQREERRELERIARDAVADVARGMAPRVDVVAARRREVRLAADLRRRS